MRIGNGTFVVRTPGVQTSGRVSDSGGTPPDRDTLRTQLRRVDAEIDDLRALLRAYRGTARRGRPPSVLGVAMDLSTGATPARLTSTGEVNAEATQLSTRTPQWTGPGGRAVSIGGIYTGADDDTWTFTVDANSRKVDITDATGTLLTTVNLNADTQPQTIALPDGLTVTFAAGTTLTAGDSFTLGMWASTDGAIDPDDPLGGLGLASSRFEEGTAIGDGSFTVNGIAIQVATTDSLNDVLARITAQVAGVVAAYDAGTERVTLTTTASGAEQSIEITGDTSGLIAALKLDGVGRVAGTGTYAVQPMADTPALAGIQAGRITVDGVEITIDPTTQSLTDVLAQIDAIDGVTARLDPLGRVIMQGTTGEELVLGDPDGTGFFSTLGLQEGIHRGRRGEGRQLSEFASRRITAELLQLREALDDVVDNEGLLGLAADMRTDIGVAVETALRDEDGLERLAALTGLDDFADDRLGTRSRTVHEVRRSYDAMRTLMMGENERQDGLLERLDDIVRRGLSKVDDIDVRI